MSDTRRLPVILTLVCAAALAVLVSLGVWQMQRLAWKQDLLSRIEAARTAPPVMLDEALARPEPEFARVALVCRGLDHAPYIELRTLMEGEPGVRLVSLCSPDIPILVDRGFVAETISARPPSDGGTMPVAVRAPVMTTASPTVWRLEARGLDAFCAVAAALASALACASTALASAAA